MNDQDNQTNSSGHEAREINSLTNPDLGRDSWIGKQEKGWITRAMIGLGGITSFGGLFPAFANKLSGIFDGWEAVRFYEIYSLLYFVLPILVYLIWVVATERVGLPDDVKYKNWQERFKYLKASLTWISHRYWLILAIHICLITISIYNTIDHSAGDYKPSYYAFLGLPFLTAWIAVMTMAKRKSNNLRRKVSAGILLVALMSGGLFHFLAANKAQKENPALASKSYKHLLDVSQILKELGTLEENVENRLDRFSLKSSMQLGVLPDSIVSLSNDSIFRKYDIKPFLTSLGKFLLKKPDSFHPIESDFTPCTHRVQGARDSMDHMLFFDPPKYIGEYYDIKKKNYDEQNVLVVMHMVNTIVLDMLDNRSHRVYPQCLLSETSNPALREVLSAKINSSNSRKLKDWVENLYIPYCERKAKYDLEEIAEGTTWIRGGVYARGMAYGVSTMFILILCYFELILLKREEISSREQQRKGADEAMKEKLGKEIATLNTNSTHLLFPLTMAMTVIGILFIQVGVVSDISSIDPSRSYRLIDLPSLKVPAVSTSVIPGNIKDVKTKNAGKSAGNGNDTIYVLTENPVPALRDSIRELNDRLDRLDNAVGSKKRGMTEKEWENWKKKH